MWLFVRLFLAFAPESDRRDLLSELEVMKALKPHPHVIKLLGCVTETGKITENVLWRMNVGPVSFFDGRIKDISE